jgi:release factor glutamine methyltransferase
VRLKAVLTSAINRLTAEQVPSPRMNAELLLMFTLDCDRAYLYAHPERELTGEERGRYEAVLGERAQGVPAQYITGHQEFWGMDLIVSPAVLIPRPETEHVIETVLELAGTGFRDAGARGPRGLKPSLLPRSGTAGSGALPGTGDRRPLSKTSDRSDALVDRAGGQECPPHTIRIADVGTGSGCIALALAKELPGAEVYATDVSAAALEIARANAARLGFRGRIEFRQTDLLAGLPCDFDFIVSNLPYVGESEEDQVQLEVRRYEPRSAVFAGPTGVEVIARLIPQARAALRPGGWLVLEISATIVSAVQGLLQHWEEARVISDLQSIPRVVQARKPRG